MPAKQVKGVIVPRHDTAVRWSRATNFFPKQGELIVFDADAEGVVYETILTATNKDGTTESFICKSSSVNRFKFGDGNKNVNNLPFATISEDWVREYVSDHTGAVVYLNTKECIGRNLELQDVYPIQPDESTLKIVSKNKVVYATATRSTRGVTINNTTDGVKVTGTAASVISNAQLVISNSVLTTPGKYTLSVDNGGIISTEKTCYMIYSLYSDAEGKNLIQEYQPITTTPVIIDTEELNCALVRISVLIKAETGQSFSGTESQVFRVQLEQGVIKTPYTPYKDETNLAGKKINIYSKNLYQEGISSQIPNGVIKVNNEPVVNGNTLGTHYVKGIMTVDNTVIIDLGGLVVNVTTPLFTNDKFTFIYTVSKIDTTTNTLHIENVQIVYGHTDYTMYEAYHKATVESNADGVCDISSLNYPYSFVSIDEDDGYAVYIKYDPALSRNWTERQLDMIREKLSKNEQSNIDTVNALTESIGEINTILASIVEGVG